LGFGCKGARVRPGWRLRVATHEAEVGGGVQARSQSMRVEHAIHCCRQRSQGQRSRPPPPLPLMNRAFAAAAAAAAAAASACLLVVYPPTYTVAAHWLRSADCVPVVCSPTYTVAAHWLRGTKLTSAIQWKAAASPVIEWETMCWLRMVNSQCVPHTDTNPARSSSSEGASGRARGR
jgi:hypothetical protein